MSESRFGGRRAVVTGAAGDIGRAVVAQLAAEGADVWALDLHPEAIDPLPSVRPVQVDVTDSGQVDEVFARAAADGGPIDLLVNAAGGPGSVRTAVDQVTDQDWHRVTALNLDGVFYCSRAAAAAMKRGAGGAIVNISSGAGRTWTRTGVQAYAAAKAGVIGLTRQLARELGPRGVRVNAIAPGLIEVAATKAEVAAMSTDERERHLAGVALGRLGRADDLVGPVLFFLSDEARFVTGQTISVDGGSIMLG